ncbi:right-handed parallel beta-helix repeat-containing protein [Deinococcus marmoris]|uniref:right-handed parallel beta-helix repeat-containing protein n=1 Tax=Deinococcus marmoris TaxID=249408 RepID=UPI000495BCB2|nr:right-handed parallel beta-helix repeat-containing protein [Deinococcus marmoris]
MTARCVLSALILAAALPATAGLVANPALRLEAEAGMGNTGAPMQERVGSGPAWINRVPAASQGREVMIAGQDGAVRFTLPRTLSAGTYTVAVTGYGQAFDGAPILAVLVNGIQKSRVTLDWAARATTSLRGVSLKPGDVLELRFVNDAYGGEGKDRNAVLDYVQLSAESTAPAFKTTASAPAPVVKASAVKAPTAKPPLVKAATPVAKAAPAAGSATVNVRSFGATGNGKTDDTAALNRAMASGAATVVFPEGQYLVSAPVIVQGNKRVIKADGNAQLVAASSFRGVPGQQRGMLWLRGVRDVTVQGLSIDGRKSTLPDQDDTLLIQGILATGSDTLIFRDLKIQDVTADGIAVLDSSNVLTEGNQITGTGRHGIWTFQTNNQVHRRNTVTGLGFTGSDDRRRRGGGIALLGTLGNGFIATDNILKQSSDTATKTEGMSQVEYRGNTIDTFGKDGIKVMPYPPKVASIRDVLIEKNTIVGIHPWRPDGSGYIVLQSVQGGRVLNNTVQGSKGEGEPYQEDAVRVNTYASGPQSSQIVIEGNDLRDTRRGVRLASDGAVVRGNTISGTSPWSRSGLIVSGQQVQILNNTFKGEVVGVLLDKGIRATRVQGNTFENHEQAAIYANNENPDTAVVDNRFGSGINMAVAGQINPGENCRGNTGGSCP